MKQTREEAVEKAKADLAGRLSINAGDITVLEVIETDFSDMSLGAAAGGEMAAQMISTGWKIRFDVAGKCYEYRADKYQLRLVDFEGENFLVQ
jgi:hypothetical protein